MKDIYCRRCGNKIGWRWLEGNGGVTIRCECGATNPIGLEISSFKGLDSTLGMGVTIAMTTA